MSKERPILFSDPMVRAILEGRKTQTRRVVKAASGRQSEWLTHELISKVPHGEMVEGGWQMHHPKAGTTHQGIDIAYDSPLGWVQCPYGVPGDRLWVRESWADVTACFGDSDEIRNAAYKADEAVYSVSHEPVYLEQLGVSGIYVDKWKPSIHMPRHVSRINLEITNVRVERLQAINEQDAANEGVEQRPRWPGDVYGENPVEAFNRLWDVINGTTYPWQSNPWVWVVQFKKL